MKKPAKPKPKRRSRKGAPQSRAPQVASAANRHAAPKAAMAATLPASGRVQPLSFAGRSLANLAGHLSTEDRSALALLMMPFLIVALSLTVAQSRRATLPSLPEIASSRLPDRVAVAPRPLPPPAPPMPAMPAPQMPAMPPPAPVVPHAHEVVVPGAPPAFPPPVPVIEMAAAVPAAPPLIPIPSAAAPPAARDIVVPAPLVAFPPPAPVVELPAPPRETTVAALAPTTPAPLAFPQPPLPAIDREPPSVEGLCSASPAKLASFAQVGRLARAPRQARLTGIDAATFGQRLADAAVAQTRDLVIYTARYQAMAYPMGDVMALHGACIDVVIRAYRALGIDLQEEIQKARPSRGDTNIDHRRTENMRRFLERAGASLPITPYPEDYKPGDIVTYHRPFSRISTSHIAVVTDVLAPSGRPMIVHNRGYGPQLEDALFVDRITGHYRYMGEPVPAARASHSSGRPQAVVRASLQGTAKAQP